MLCNNGWLTDEGRGMREEGRGMREEGRGKREEGRGKREEERGKMLSVGGGALPDIIFVCFVNSCT